MWIWCAGCSDSRMPPPGKAQKDVTSIAERNEADQLLTDLGQRTAVARISRLILYLMERLNARDMVRDLTFSFPLRQQHIADGPAAGGTQNRIAHDADPHQHQQPAEDRRGKVGDEVQAGRQHGDAGAAILGDDGRPADDERGDGREDERTTVAHR